MAEEVGTDTDLLPLVGTEDATIDNRGRILLPKKMRDRLGNLFALTLGDFGCICAYPKVHWKRLDNEINSYPLNSQGRKKYSQFVYGQSDDELSCDAQGRVIIQPQLAEVGKLKDKVKIVGCGNHLELWDPEELKKYTDSPDAYEQKRREDMQKAYDEMRSQ